MSDITDRFFGGSEKQAGKQAAKEIGKGRAAIEAAAPVAREDLFRLFGGASESRRGGLEGALDVFRSTLPQQAGVTQEGNVAAQATLLAGLPQIQAAILGRPTDLGAIQPTRIPFDFDFTQAEIPGAPGLEASAPAAAQSGGLTAEDIRSLLAGRPR